MWFSSDMKYQFYKGKDGQVWKRRLFHSGWADHAQWKKVKG